ncbi:protein O-mannosyl-transferase TMTC2-like [Diorhabda carinulata]|uniref:protein O-mannosyl-transferase TMTC2-like n=1 Tax=Diorhabda carinulata TaxID=1163345 RepID=UPI0025A21C58|nr:protein O-mannosyl-transferase TMTC2-like [Diorhabda carinulata]XP_057663007.1 protein O-mannosyl-transferase TMTC2-like [Diorhabda carinulata]
MDYVSTVCCILAFLLYYNTLDAGFVYDDRRAILSNPDLLSKTPWSRLLENDFWGTPLSDSGSHGSYRPLCVLTFRINYALGGFQPWGYHLVNVLLHCLATVLLIRVARIILPKPKSKIGSMVTGLVFATHPIHTEAVAGVVGRADLAACNFYFLSLLAYVAHVRYRDTQYCHRFCRKSSIIKSDSKQYQKIVYALQKNVTSCNWPKRHLRDIEHTELSSVSVFMKKKDNKNLCCWKNNLKLWIYLVLCLLLAVAAMLSKETGITVLGICFIYDWVYCISTNKKQIRSLLILASALSLILAARLQSRTPHFSSADNPTARETEFFTRFFTFFYLPIFNFWLLIFPNTLSFDWGMEAIPRITTIKDIRNIVSLVFYYGIAVILKKCMLRIRKKVKREERPKEDNKSCTVCHMNCSDIHSSSCRTTNNNNTTNFSSSFCVCYSYCRPLIIHRPEKRQHNSNAAIVLSFAFLALPFLPATNMLFYVGFVVAERVLYLPSAGLCLLLGLASGTLWDSYKRHRPVLVCGLVLVLVAFSAKTVIRNKDWYNEEALYRSAIPINPPKAYGNLGSVLSSQGRVDEAEMAFRKALHYRPNMADVHYNLGILLQGKNKLDEAILSYQRAIHFRPSLALAYVNLGTALISTGRCQEAASILRQGSRLNGTGLKDRKEHETAKVSALLQLGALYSDQGRLQRALAAYREAAHSLPDHYPPQSVFNVLGETLARLEQDEEAERWYIAALHAQPDHVPAHITYGKLLAKNMSRVAEAEQWFRKAQKIAPKDPSVFHHYGEFLASRRRYKEAANMYEKAAELRPEDYELAVAAATAMRQAVRYQDAERWYRKAVSINPTDARSHTNLGAILHLNGKYREAADSYRESLRLQPNDVTTLANLHKLHTVMT